MRRHPVIATCTVITLAAMLMIMGVLIDRNRRIAASNELILQSNRQIAASERLLRTSLAGQHVEKAGVLMEQGNLFEALLWSVEALRLDSEVEEEKEEEKETEKEKEKEKEREHRMRIGSILMQSPRLVALLGHEGPVRWAEFSRSGKQIVTASDDETARVWNAETGELAVPAMRHGGAVNSARFSRNSLQIVTACEDGASRVWDARTGRQVLGELRHPAPVRYAEFHPDNRHFVAASADATLRLWDASNGAMVWDKRGSSTAYVHACFSPDGQFLAEAYFSDSGTAHLWRWQEGEGMFKHAAKFPSRDYVPHVAFAPDNQRLAVAIRDGKVRVVSTETLEDTCEPLWNKKRVNCLGFSPDNMFVAVGYQDGTAQVWSSESGQTEGAALKHLGELRCVTFSPDARWVATASDDGSARLWDKHTGQPLCPPLWHAGPVNQIALSPKGQFLVTASSDGFARVWDLKPLEEACVRLGHTKLCEQAIFHPTNTSLATLCFDTYVRFWDGMTGAPLSPRLETHFRPYAAQYSADARHFAAASADSKLHRGAATLWEMLPDGTPRGERRLEHPHVVADLDFSDDSRWLVTAGGDGRARIWDVETASVRRELITPVRGARFGPDGKRVATFNGLEAYVWDVESAQRLAGPLAHRSYIQALSFSPDGRVLATAGEDRTTCLWDAATGKLLRAPLAHGGMVVSVIFSRDGALLLTASRDRQARLWEADSGVLRFSLRHPEILHAAVFTPDQKYVVTACADGAARVWSVETGELAVPPLWHEGEVKHVSVSHDGLRVSLAGDGDSARVWRLEVATAPLEQLASLAELLSCQRIGDSGKTVPLGRPELAQRWRQTQYLMEK